MKTTDNTETLILSIDSRRKYFGLSKIQTGKSH